jgi:hypothetical protein
MLHEFKALPELPWESAADERDRVDAFADAALQASDGDWRADASGLNRGAAPREGGLLRHTPDRLSGSHVDALHAAELAAMLSVFRKKTLLGGKDLLRAERSALESFRTRTDYEGCFHRNPGGYITLLECTDASSARSGTLNTAH